LKRVAVKTQTVDFELNRDTKKLEEIEVIARPIEKYGDTLQYLVSAFARQDDRSIEDVLKRMPGIEVKENGQITYQGTPIEKFYVEGSRFDGR
jgi:polyhydroxyalkanoate synthesis regulator protein